LLDGLGYDTVVLVSVAMCWAKNDSRVNGRNVVFYLPLDRPGGGHEVGVGKVKYLDLFGA